MTAKEFYDELGKILKVHPEAGEAMIWAHVMTGEDVWDDFRIKAIGFDKKRKPARIKLYD